MGKNPLLSENPIWAYELFIYWWLGINKHHWTSFLGNIPEVLKVPEKLVPVFCAPWGRSQGGKGIWGRLSLCLVRLVESWKLAAPCPFLSYSPLLSSHWTNPLGPPHECYWAGPTDGLTPSWPPFPRAFQVSPSTPRWQHLDCTFPVLWGCS